MKTEAFAVYTAVYTQKVCITGGEISMIDLHCDTVSRVGRPLFHRGNLLQNPYQVDVTRLEEAGALVQCFSTFFFTGHMRKKTREEKAFKKAEHLIDVFDKNVELCEGRLVPVHTKEDLVFCQEHGRVGGLLTLEDGVPVGRSLDRLRYFYDRGIRLITLTWNFENSIGFPNSMDPDVMNSGLKPFGFEVLEEMNRLGMIVDVSHLSDEGFWDVARHSRKPFIASHSNARSLTLHPRNLTDTMIREISEKGGVIGLNFCPKFLNGTNKSQIVDMRRHIRHIYQVGGEDVLALGTDFDGITGKFQISGCQELHLLRENLSRHKLPERIIDKMWQGNALRVMNDIL